MGMIMGLSHCGMSWTQAPMRASISNLLCTSGRAPTLCPAGEVAVTAAGAARCGSGERASGSAPNHALRLLHLPG